MSTADEILNRNGLVEVEGEMHRGQIRMAYRLARQTANELMYVHGIGWYAWDGKRWAADQEGRAKRAVLAVLRKALAESLGDKRLRADVGRCETSSGIKGVLDVASCLAGFAYTVDALDTDPFLLNCANGTLDLRSLELREHDPADRITKVTAGAYQTGTVSEEWQQFLERVLPDPDVRHYFQRFVGLSLLGKVREHLFAIATGTGANGKGTAYGAILNTMGDYGHAAETDLFMSAKANPNAASPALMGLLGKRFVVVSETERDHRLAVALMKNLTGGDRITARPLYGAPVSFAPTHTSLMVTNFLPKVSGNDPAAWRRIRVIPFNVVIPEADRDEKLGERLELAADAILSWAVDGWRRYDDDGLPTPAAVLAATDDYQRDSDAVARFLADDAVVCDGHGDVGSADLYRAFVDWLRDQGEAVEMTQKTFTAAMETHGYSKSRTKTGVRWRGLSLVPQDSDGSSWSRS